MRRIHIFLIVTAACIALPFFYVIPLKKYFYPVEKIYIINLDKDKDRFTKISSSLEKQKLHPTRFPAVYGVNLEIIDSNGKKFIGADLKSGKLNFRIGETYKILCPNVTLNYRYKPADSIDGMPLTADEFGVYCSHMEIMLDTIKNKYKSVIVFEDDALIPENFVKELTQIEKSMPNYKKLNIIYLGHAISSNKMIDYYQKVKNIPFNNALQLITNYDINLGSVHAIMYGYLGAKRMLKMLESNPNAGIDLDLFRELNLHSKHYVLKAKNLNILQDFSTQSSISSMGRIL